MKSRRTNYASTRKSDDKAELFSLINAGKKIIQVEKINHGTVTNSRTTIKAISAIVALVD